MGITPTPFFLVLLEAVLDFYGPRVMVQNIYPQSFFTRVIKLLVQELRMSNF